MKNHLTNYFPNGKQSYLLSNKWENFKTSIMTYMSTLFKQAFQTNIFNGIQLSITFFDVHDQSLKELLLNKVWFFVKHFKAKKINNENHNYFFTLHRSLLRNNCYANNNTLCIVLIQNYRMLRNHMILMIVVPWSLLYIYQYFMVQGKTLSYHFLLYVMAHNTSHLSKLRAIYSNNMIINLKQGSHTCYV
jgi:hypothetical protein